MKARTPLQLTPRTTASGTIRVRLTQNNDLYGGARPREDVLAARGPTKDPRYPGPSAAHISDEFRGDEFRGPRANPDGCPWCDGYDHTPGMDCPTIQFLCPPHYPPYLESPRLQDLQNRKLNINIAPLRPSNFLLLLVDFLLFVLLLVLLVRASKGRVESQSDNEFKFLIAKKFDPPIDELDVQTGIEFDSPTDIEFDSPIAIELDLSIAEFDFSDVSNSTFNTRIQRSTPNARYSTTDLRSTSNAQRHPHNTVRGNIPPQHRRALGDFRILLQCSLLSLCLSRCHGAATESTSSLSVSGSFIYVAPPATKQRCRAGTSHNHRQPHRRLQAHDQPLGPSGQRRGQEWSLTCAFRGSNRRWV